MQPTPTPIIFLHGWGTTSQSFAPISKFFQNTCKCIFVEFDCNPKCVMTLDDYVDIVEQKLIDEKVTTCHVIGHSFGCRVAVLLARRNPHMIRKMVLTGAAGLRPRFNIKTWSKIKLYKMFKVGKGSTDYQKLSPTGKKTFKNIIHRNLAQEIYGLKTPTLLIYGKKDTATPIYMARKWAKLQGNTATLKIYPKAGHYAFIDAPQRFITDAYAFLEAK